MPDAVPPFMAELQLWPYVARQSFITQLEANGGVAEIDEALRTFPITWSRSCTPSDGRRIVRRLSMFPTSRGELGDPAGATST